MRSLVIIPARHGSQRFPGKMLADLEGKSVIVRTLEQCQKAGGDMVLVATDDKRILKEVEAHGGSAILTEGSHRSGTERCAEALSKSEQEWDLIINVQGDEPFVRPQQIDELLGLFKDREVEIASLACKLQEEGEIRDPSRVKVVFDRNGNALYFSRSPIPYVRPKKEAEHYQHIGIYAYRAEILPELATLPPAPLESSEGLEQLRWMENGYRIQLALSTPHPAGIDTEKDLEEARSLIRSGYMDNGPGSH